MAPAPHSRPTLVYAYDRLRALFYRELKLHTRDCHITFTSPFARLEYISKATGYVSTEGYRRINNFRGRLNRIRHGGQQLYLSDHLLQDDALALAHFIAHIEQSDLPDELASLLPTAFAHALPPEPKEESALADAMRVVVVTWDAVASTITVRDEDEDGQWEVAVLSNAYGPWDNLFPLLKANTTLSLVAPMVDPEGRIHPTLIIYEPDLLVDISAIARCLQPHSASPRNYLLDLLASQQITAPILLGNLASQMLDEEILALRQGSAVDTPYEQTANRYFAQHAIDLSICPELQDPAKRTQFHDEARQQQHNIRHIVRRAFTDDRQIHLDDILLEPSFVSPMLGIQGRMDLLQSDLRVLMEQKSGKLQFRTEAVRDEHYLQMLLYLSYLHFNRGMRNEEVSSYLLYSKYPDGLKQTTTAPSRIGLAFRIRNGIVWLQQSLAQGGIRILDQWTPESLNEQHLDGKLWFDYVRPRLAELLDTVHHVTPLERMYFYRMFTFVANEHLLSKAGNTEKETGGFASLWNASLTEKLQSGDIMLRMQVSSYAETMPGEGYDVVTLDLDLEEADTLPNFRVGDIVVLYPYALDAEPDVRQVLILRASVQKITSDSVTLRLRAPQRNVSVFKAPKGGAWAIEHDLMESSHTSLYRSCFAFLRAARERRQLLLAQRQPEVDTSVQLVGDYGGDYFNQLVLRAKQAKDFFLVMGPPGTGKTSYGLVNILRETLATDPSANVLLMSYTNRAVDEICSKLLALGVPFLRMGGDLQCPEVCRPYLFSEQVSRCSGAGEVRHLLTENHILVGTTTALTARIGLLQLRRFDLAIVDEASQILEPHLLGLLSATWHDGTSAIRKFVFIGDHKQLPAVVQQTPMSSQVNEPELQDIGLRDTRESLFERLHRLYAGRPEVEYHLTRQGRMHAEVAEFASHHFYAGQLVPVPLDHQLSTLSTYVPHPDDTPEMRLLSRWRVAFLDSSVDAAGKPSGAMLPDKVNPYEAELTARLVYAWYVLHHERENVPFDPQQSVGVIVPYRNQIAMVRRALSAYGVPELLDISIDTVERYQGSQRDLIVYSFTVRRPYQLDFLTSSRICEDEKIVDRKLNVALTRARLQMVMVGDVPLLCRDPLFSSLIDRYFISSI